MGPILFYIIEKTVGKIWAWASAKVATWWLRRQRAKDQAEKQEKVEGDVKTGAKRDEETEKNEQDWLNS